DEGAAAQPARQARRRGRREDAAPTQKGIDALVDQVSEAPAEFAESVDMWQTVEAMQLVSKKMPALCKVGKQDAEGWLGNCIDELSDVKKIKNLHLDTLKQGLVDARVALSKFFASMGDVEFPLAFTPYKEKFGRLHESHQAAWKAVLRAKAGAQAVQAEQSGHDQKANESWRANRDKYRKYFAGRGAPTATAKVVGDTIYSMACPPGEVDIDLSYESPECNVVEGSTADVFTRPFRIKFNASEDRAQKDHFHNVFGQLYLDNKIQATAKMRECNQVMKQPTANMCCTFGSIQLSTDIDLKPSWVTDASKRLQPIVGLRSVVRVSHTESVDVTLDAWPWRGVPAFLTQDCGRSVISVVPPDVATAIGNPQEWLASLSSDGLQDYPAWMLEEGSSLFVPCGSFPIIVGACPLIDVASKEADLKATKGKDNQRHLIGLGVQPMFDVAFLKEQASPKVVNRVLATYQEGEGKNLKSWTEKVSEWKRDLGEWVQAAAEKESKVDIE
ncbi:unnamed protein product, partial [Prorocentrum cordatum]